MFLRVPWYQRCTIDDDDMTMLRSLVRCDRFSPPPPWQAVVYGASVQLVHVATGALLHTVVQSPSPADLSASLVALRRPATYVRPLCVWPPRARPTSSPSINTALLPPRHAYPCF